MPSGHVPLTVLTVIVAPAGMYTANDEKPKDEVDGVAPVSAANATVCGTPLTAIVAPAGIATAKVEKARVAGVAATPVARAMVYVPLTGIEDAEVSSNRNIQRVILLLNLRDFGSILETRYRKKVRSVRWNQIDLGIVVQALYAGGIGIKRLVNKTHQLALFDKYFHAGNSVAIYDRYHCPEKTF